MAFKMKGFSGFKQTEGNQGNSPVKKRDVKYHKDADGNVVKTVTRGKEGELQPRKIKTKTYSKDTGEKISKKVSTDKYDPATGGRAITKDVNYQEKREARKAKRAARRVKRKEYLEKHGGHNPWLQESETPTHEKGYNPSKKNK